MYEWGSTKLKGKELTYDTVKMLRPGDIILTFYKGKVYSDNNPNAFHSSHVTSVLIYNDHVTICTRPLYMNDKVVTIGREYLNGGTGCISLYKTPGNFPHRLFLLGHTELVDYNPISPSPGNTSYDLMS